MTHTDRNNLDHNQNNTNRVQDNHVEKIHAVPIHQSQDEYVALVTLIHVLHVVTTLHNKAGSATNHRNKNVNDGSDNVCNPMKLFRNLAELQSLAMEQKKGAMAVESAATSASSAPQGRKTSTKSSSSSSNSASSLGSSNEGPDFPTNNPDYPQPPFDPNDVPTSENDVRQRFNDWMRAIRSSSNPNTLFAFLEWLTNVQNKLGNQPYLQKMFNELASMKSADGTSFAEMVISALRSSWYYQGNYDVAKEMQKLANLFQGMSKDNDLFKSLAFYASNEAKTIDSWIQQQKENPVSKDDFFYYQFGQIYDWFHNNTSLRQKLHHWFMEQVDDLVRRFKNNPALLIALIFTVFGGTMNNMQFQFGDYGTLNKRLADISKKLSNVQKDFTDLSKGDKVDPKTLQKLVEEIKHLKYEIKQLKRMFGDSISARTNEALDKILNAKAGDNTTLKDLMNQKNPDWAGAAKYMQDHHIFHKPGSTEKGKESAGGSTELTTEIEQAFDVAVKAISSQSQVVSVKMGQISKEVQTMSGEIKSMVLTNYSQGWLGTLVKNQIRP